MRSILTSIIILSLFSCVSLPINTAQVCSGNSNLNESIANKFVAIDDKQLLTEALGIPGEGKLCQGQVYKSKKDTQITLYRVWNSTNANSKFGNWWAFQKPSGETSKYRSDYQICYQWSPLDKLVRCSLKPEIKIVVGTGQSEKCSGDLTYPESDKQQIYINNASTSVTNCTTFVDKFSWK